jgi:hypothetical protein
MSGLPGGFREKLIQIQYSEGRHTNWIPLYLEAQAGALPLARVDTRTKVHIIDGSLVIFKM